MFLQNAAHIYCFVLYHIILMWNWVVGGNGHPCQLNILIGTSQRVAVFYFHSDNDGSTLTVVMVRLTLSTVRFFYTTASALREH